MSMSMKMRSVLLAVVAGVVPLPTRAEERLELRPSVVLGQVWDDNIFSSAEEPQADAITSLGPGLTLALRGRHFGASLSYSREGQMFGRLSSLNTTGAGQSAVGTLSYAGAGGLRLDAIQAYTTTLNPGQLAPTTGLDLGRRPAWQVSSEQTLSVPLGERSKGSLRYAFAMDEVEGAFSGQTHSAGATLERRSSERTSVTLGYTLRRFAAGGVGVTSHVVLGGWTASLGPRTTLRVAAGPRIAAGEPAPEIDVSLRHQMKGGELQVAYGQTEARILGLAGVGSTESATVSFSRDIVHSLRFGVSPGVYRNRAPQTEWTVYRVGSRLVWTIGRSVSIVGSHEFASTRGGVPGSFLHNVYSVRLTVAPPGRPLVAAAPPRRSGAGEEEP